MKKVVLILAIAMMWSAHAQARAVDGSGMTSGYRINRAIDAIDRDCVKYSASDAMAATNADDNTFSATFSGVAERKGNSNADCTASAKSIIRDTDMAAESRIRDTDMAKEMIE